MNAGDGHIVGMSVLPTGIAPEDNPEVTVDDVDEVAAEELLEVSDGPWLFTLTKKVIYIDS